MEEEYQKKEMMKDLWNKDERIRELEKELSDVLDLLKKTTEKYIKVRSVSLEGLRHIDSPIARDTEQEIFEA